MPASLKNLRIQTASEERGAPAPKRPRVSGANGARPAPRDGAPCVFALPAAVLAFSVSRRCACKRYAYADACLHARQAWPMMEVVTASVPGMV